MNKPTAKYIGHGMRRAYHSIVSFLNAGNRLEHLWIAIIGLVVLSMLLSGNSSQVTYFGVGF